MSEDNDGYTPEIQAKINNVTKEMINMCYSNNPSVVLVALVKSFCHIVSLSANRQSSLALARLLFKEIETNIAAIFDIREKRKEDLHG
jgi:hypothetical protein